jgi:hypothetical protein
LAGTIQGQYILSAASVRDLLPCGVGSAKPDPDEPSNAESKMTRPVACGKRARSARYAPQTDPETAIMCSLADQPGRNAGRVPDLLHRR